MMKTNDIAKMILEGCLLTAGNIDNHNTMTIGWGQIGTIWGKEVFVCYVRPNRYTYQFMEENDYFTISFYDSSYRNAMGILGTKSGRDTNKEAEVNFHPVDVDGITTTFKEAKLSLVCKRIYKQDLDASQVISEVKNKYYAKEPFHRLYIGEIVKVIE